MSFIQFGFVIAGAAAMSLPVWIHLLLRQRARPVEIGSIRFVKNVVRRTKSRQQIQRWLLLAMRAAAMLLLGLLFARPFLPDTPLDGRTREVAILIDRSASMSAMHQDGNSAMDESIKRARRYVDSLGDRVKVHFGLFDASGVETVSLAQLSQLNPASTATRFQDALGWASDVLGASNRADKSVLVLSDLQRGGLRPSDDFSMLADLEVQIDDPAPSIAQNTSIEQVAATQVELRPGVPVTLAVRIVNAGAFPVKRLPVVLELEGPSGSIVQQEEVSIAPGTGTTVDIELAITQPGIYQGQCTIERDDPLLFDNRRYVAFEVRHPDRLLLVDGDPGRKSWESEAYFLETALRLQTPIGDSPSRTFEIEKLIWDQGSGFPDLAGFRLIVLANLGRFSDSDARRLHRFVSEGGNAMWFVGERTGNAVIDSLTSAGLIGTTTIGSAVDTLAAVSEFDREHPALSPFRNPQYGDLRSLKTRRLMPVRSLDAETHVLLDSRRSPLVISHPSGQGRFVFVGTSADRSWNDWPQNRLFVPLVRQLAAWMTGQLDARQPVIHEWITEARQTPGISTDDSSLIVRNIDPVESDIGRFGTDQFREATGLPEEPLDLEDKRIREFVPAGAARADEKWPILVWILLGVLGIELLLASRTHE